ncbi:MAG: hypothetical protein LBT05_14305 [Planctomycetaceae bacterium]|jgi:hypothetical protein|nr:hypothetical protein [Planctomycetaceae bacterium]
MRRKQVIPIVKPLQQFIKIFLRILESAMFQSVSRFKKNSFENEENEMQKVFDVKKSPVTIERVVWKKSVMKRFVLRTSQIVKLLRIVCES